MLYIFTDGIFIIRIIYLYKIIVFIADLRRGFFELRPADQIFYIIYYIFGVILLLLLIENIKKIVQKIFRILELFLYSLYFFF